MKKRILALALAGTTAFSVFGAAMSASAANSTHTAYTVDAYVSYKPVAKTIKSVAAVTKTTKTYTDVATGTINITDVDAHMADKVVKDNYTPKYYIAGLGYLNTDLTPTDGSITDGELTAAGITKVTAGNDSEGNTTPTYLYGGKTYSSFAAVIAEAVKVSGNSYMYYWAANWTKDAKTPAEYDALLTKAEYVAKNLVETSSSTATTTAPSLKVNDDTPAIWAWNADTTGEATIDFTYYVDYADAIVETQPTIFAYDFVYNNNMDSTAAGVGAVWSDETKAANAIGTHTLVAEDGYGVPYKGVRYEVVNEWVDFLEELAINADNGYHETYATFEKMYADLFYADPIYSPDTGKLVGAVDVDLYNIKGLLKDIYALNNAAAYTKANTSELVYLMQQYDKYIGEYITPTEVNTSDWGALMLSVLESVEADDFSKSADYKKYVNKVEELADAYEDATAVGMIAAAEQGMYDLLTTSIKNTSGSKTELAATINGLYFNAKNAPATYATNWKNAGDAQYVNFTYFYASMLPAWGNDRYDNGNVYYSLYPQADYKEANNGVATYTGNKAKYEGTATDEYEWFLNVYELASAMKATSKVPQGALDAIDAALNEAVEALEVTVAPYNATVAAKEDMMDYVAASIKEESDYVEAYYGMYETAVDYAENVAEGEWQNRVARAIVGISGDSLTWQGTQLTITKNEITSLKNAIKEANAAIDAIKNSKDYNAAQVTALNKAIAKAQKVVDIYTGTEYAEINKDATVKVGDKDEIVKSDVTNAIAAIDAAIKGGSVIQGWSQDANGAWQYGEGDEYLNDGWNKIGSVWYYFDEDGTAKQSEWLNLDGKWYWFNSNCGAAIGWAKVDGDWYYFGGNNAMKTGWQKVDGNWYYLAGSGKMTTGWVQVDGKWYYMSKESNSLGQMLSNTTVEGYKLGADGAMIEK